MANIVRIKRRVNGMPGAPTSMANAELAFNEVDFTLYYGAGDDGNGGSTTVRAIAGSGAYTTLATAQTITGAKSFTGAVTSSIALTVADNSTAVATTQWVTSKIAAVSSGVTTFMGRSGAVSLLSADITAALGFTPTNYTLPTASQSVKGGVMIGTGISVASDGTISVAPSVTGVTSFMGRTGNVTLTTTEIWNITDGRYVTPAAADAKYLPLAGGTIAGSLSIGGNLNIGGTLTTVNEVIMTITDKVITLGKVATPSDATAQGGGVILLGTTSKTILWDNGSSSWVSSENFGLATGKGYRIAGFSVLDYTTLGSSVVNSSLTKVGTITSGVWNGSTIDVARGGTGVTSISGLIKGSGTSPFSAAVPGVDYLSPSSIIDGGTF